MIHSESRLMLQSPDPNLVPNILQGWLKFWVWMPRLGPAAEFGPGSEFPWILAALDPEVGSGSLPGICLGESEHTLGKNRGFASRGNESAPGMGASGRKCDVSLSPRRGSTQCKRRRLLIKPDAAFAGSPCWVIAARTWGVMELFNLCKSGWGEGGKIPLSV